MADQVFMNTTEVGEYAESFGNISDVLKSVSDALGTTIEMLDGLWFVGLVGGDALSMYLKQIKPSIDNLAAKCTEIQKDLKFAVAAYENGDEQGASRFH